MSHVTPTSLMRLVASLLAASALLALIGRPAPAQTLPALLPADVHLAIGLIELGAQADRLQPFLDEAERLGLLPALRDALPGAGPSSGGPFNDDGALAGLAPLDLLGREAWIAVSASRFEPLPSVTVIALLTPAASDAFASAIAEAASSPGTTERQEAGSPFYTFVPSRDETSGPTGGVPLAFAQSGEVVVVSTNPEVVRFVLRTRAGGSDARLVDNPAYRALEALGEGEVRAMIDPAPLTRGLEPLAASNGAAALLARLQAALATAGPSVGVLRADDQGLLGLSRQRPDPAGGDVRLYALLSEGLAPTPRLLSFTPGGAPSVSAGTADLAGWLAWLDDLLASAADLGVPTASEGLELLDLDPQALLLAWAGSQAAVIQTAPPTPPTAGLADAPLLGEQILLIRSTDDVAARAGLERLLAVAGQGLAALLSPSGEGGTVPVSVEVAGVPVSRLSLSETLILDAAVVDGWALLSGSPDATEAVLAAHASGADGPAELLALADELPADLRSWNLTGAPSGESAGSEAWIAQVQLLAGMGGASGLDFEAVDRASDAISGYAAFLADRIGPSLAWTRWLDGALESERRIYLDW